MLYTEQSYHILIVSASDKMNAVCRDILNEYGCFHLTLADNIAAAQRKTTEQRFDFVIVNAPLPDEYGTSFAIDTSLRHGSVVMLLIYRDDFERITARASARGVFTLLKPTNQQTLKQSIQWMITTRNRMSKLEDKAVSIEEKMKEIRLINKAKWVLIEAMNMSENEAHHYIEKKAMDHAVSRVVIAQDIIDTYQ